MMQDISKFKLPNNFRGRSAFVVQVWWLVQATIFRWSPQIFYGFRVFLLRIFGAKIGDNVLIRPSVTVTYPWKIAIGSYCWIGDDVVLYSLGDIKIGCNSVVSQKSYICAGDHDYESLYFDIRARPISLGERIWIATDVYVGPGVTIGDGVVVGARSTVIHDLPSNTVCLGSPCKPRKVRKVHPNS